MIPTVARVAIIYLILMVLFRILGKRELSQLAPLELVMLLLIPELLSQSLIDDDFSLTNGLIAVTTLMTMVFLTSALMYRFKAVERLVEGKSTLLMKHGRFIADEMHHERVPPDEIISEMRRAGIERLEDVKWAVLDTGGKVAIIGWREGEVHRDEEEMPT